MVTPARSCPLPSPPGRMPTSAGRAASAAVSPCCRPPYSRIPSPTWPVRRSPARMCRRARAAPRSRPELRLPPPDSDPFFQYISPLFCKPVEASMKRAPLWRALAALAVIATSLFLVFTMTPRLGLDLRGGTQLVFETMDSKTVKADAEAADRTLDVLQRRADALGVVDPTLVRSGEKRIIVELPGLLDSSKAAEVIGKTAQLSFHAVTGVAEPG